MPISEQVLDILEIQNNAELKKRYVEPRLNNINSAYQGLVEELGLGELEGEFLRLDYNLSNMVVSRYIKSVAQQKLVHDLQRTSWEKVGGGLAYWILRIKPVQLLKEIPGGGNQNWQLFHFNEMVAFHAGLGLELDDDNTQVEFIVNRLKEKGRYRSTIAHLKIAPLVPDVLIGEFSVHQIYSSFLSSYSRQIS